MTHNEWQMELGCGRVMTYREWIAAMKRELVRITDVYGLSHYVLRDDLSGPMRMIHLFRRNGRPFDYDTDGVTHIHRDNIAR